MSEVTTGKVNGLGTVLVDGQGFTLYLFVPDDHSSQSVCTGICAIEWPPLLLPKGTPAPRAGHGINPALLRTTTRSDGTVQVVYNGWPLYLWPDDLSPGQATGQGLNNVGGLWYVVSPQGSPIRS
jgi:predicted lipoprotein with Yx(FWY)xxD motif